MFKLYPLESQFCLCLLEKEPSFFPLWTPENAPLVDRKPHEGGALSWSLYPWVLAPCLVWLSGSGGLRNQWNLSVRSCGRYCIIWHLILYCLMFSNYLIIAELSRALDTANTFALFLPRKLRPREVNCPSKFIQKVCNRIELRNKVVSVSLWFFYTIPPLQNYLMSCLLN